MRSLLKLFLPQRMDAVFLSACFLACCLVVTGFLWMPATLGLVFSAAMFWAIGAAAGCRQLSRGRGGILLALALAGWALAAPAFIELSTEPTNYKMPRVVFKAIESTKSWPLYPYLLPLIGLASLALHWLIAMITDRWTSRLVSIKKEGQQRVRWLTGLAVLMLVIHQTIQFSQFEINPIAATGFIILPALFSFLISDALTGKWSWLKIAFCFLTTVVVWFALAINNPKFLTAAAFMIPVGVGLLAVGSGVSRNLPVHSHQMETGENPARPSMRPSIWSLFPLLIAVFAMTFANSIYVPILFETRSGTTLLERLDFAWKMADFARKTESVCLNNQGTPMYEFDFASHSSNSALKKADAIFAVTNNTNQLSWSFVDLKNLTTDVDTNLSSFRSFYLTLDGTIHAKQLEELASTTSLLGIGNLNIIPGEPVNLSLTQLHLTEMNASQLKAFFDSLDPEMKPFPINIHSPLTADIWPIIAKASLQFPIRVYGTTLDDDLKKLERVPIGNLEIHAHNSGPESIPIILNSPALCDTNVELFLPLDENESALSPVEFKLLLRGARWRNEADSYQSISDWNEDQLLVYERDEAGKPQAILCPFPLDERFPTKGLTNLKTLTFNLSWIDSGTQLSSIFESEFSATTFKKIPNLEHLSIPPKYSIRNIDFLAGLFNLKHLEIGLADVPADQYIVFEKLTSLERLILWDEPDNDLLKTLAILKELKQLTIVLPNGYGKTVAIEESLAKFLPEVKATLVESSKFKPEVPASFKQHFSRVIEELKAKVAKSKESKSSDD